jgi:asparagine synthase (glutamine-hydrolysing)
VPDVTAKWAGRWWKKQVAAPWRNVSPLNPDLAAMIGVDVRAAAAGHDFRYRWHPNRSGRAIALSDFEGDWAQASKAVTGVEVRDPTADVDVVAYCLGVPPEQFLVEGIDRSLIRRAMWGLLPEIILTKRSRGVQSADWYEKLTSKRDMLSLEIARHCTSPLARRFIDLNRLAHALANWPTEGWHTPKIVEEYRFVMARGIAAARFLAWLESSG